MSVITEANDLEAVMEAAAGWDFVDKNVGHEFFAQAFEDAVQIILEYLEK